MKTATLILSLLAPFTAFAYFGGERTDSRGLPEVVFFRFVEKASPKKTWRKLDASAMDPSPDKPICTATQIRRRVFLTAGHCLTQLDPSGTRKAGSYLDLELGRVEPSGEVRAKSVRMRRWMRHPSSSEISNATLETFRGVDLAVFEIVEDVPEIAVAPLFPGPVVAGDEVRLTGFGQAGVLKLEGLEIKDPSGPLRHGELRIDARKVGKVEDGRIFSLLAKRAAGREIVRLEGFIPMSKIYPGSKPTDPAELAQWDEAQYQNRIIGPNRFNQVIVGDSGGPEFHAGPNGERMVAGVNSFCAFQNSLRENAPERVPAGMDPESVAVEFAARVDGASEGGAWVAGVLRSFAGAEPGPSGN